jgi:hypothetical protein
MKIRHALLVLPALLLVGCGTKKTDDERKATGEVLQGTISDSELPLERVSSQPPLAKAEPKPGASGAEASDAADEQDAASLDSEQPEVPAVAE